MQRKRRRLLQAAFAGSTGLLAGCAGASERAPQETTTERTDQQPNSYTVEVRTHPEYGVILTDPEGMTLYLFTNDEAGESTCYDDCAEAWPPLTVEGSPTIPDGLPGEFDTTERDDGTEQVTYEGMPLYYFQNDEEPGDATGQGANDVWFVVNPTCPGDETETAAGAETTTGGSDRPGY